jgi:hypothetical protein
MAPKDGLACPEPPSLAFRIASQLLRDTASAGASRQVVAALGSALFKLTLDAERSDNAPKAPSGSPGFPDLNPVLATSAEAQRILANFLGRNIGTLARGLQAVRGRLPQPVARRLDLLNKAASVTRHAVAVDTELLQLLGEALAKIVDLPDQSDTSCTGAAAADPLVPQAIEHKQPVLTVSTASTTCSWHRLVDRAVVADGWKCNPHKCLANLPDACQGLARPGVWEPLLVPLVGSRIRVVEAVHTEDSVSVVIPTGSRGIVIEIDQDEHALVLFPHLVGALSPERWIDAVFFDRLEVYVPEGTSVAEKARSASQLADKEAEEAGIAKLHAMCVTMQATLDRTLAVAESSSSPP